MNAYLRFRVGRQTLLADRAEIADVDTIDGTLAPSARLRTLADGAIFFDAALLLGEIPSPERNERDVVRFQLHSSAAGPDAFPNAFNVIVDRVVRFETIEEGAFRTLPRGIGAISRVADAVLVEDAGALLAFRLRPLGAIVDGPFARPVNWRRAVLAHASAAREEITS